MASTICQPIADRVVAIVAALNVTPAVQCLHAWSPRDLDKLPAAVVELPPWERVGMDDPEVQLGSDSWLFDFPITVYVDLDDPVACQTQLVEIAEAFVKAIDDDPGMGGGGPPLVDDSVVTRMEPTALVVEGRARALMTYEITLAVRALRSY